MTSPAERTADTDLPLPRTPNPEDPSVPDTAPELSDQDKLTQFSQNFYGSVYAAGGHFGRTDAAPAPARRMGRLSDTEIGTASRRYVPPAEYAAALSALHADHVVVLTGRQGTGKRSGAIALLRELTDGPLSVLSPTTSLRELAEHRYQADRGYLITEFAASQFDSRSEFDWHTVRDQVRDAQAWLVVTGSAAEYARTAPVVRIDWQPPDTHRLFAARLALAAPSRPPTVSAAAVADALPADCAMSDRIAVIDRVLQGDQLDAACRALDEAARTDVRGWFTAGLHHRRRIQEVTALAFLGPCAMRYYETQLDRLAASLLSAMPLPDRAPVPPEDVDDLMPEDRSAVAADDGLIAIVAEPSATTPKQVMQFRAPGYRRHVVAELWARMGVAFWNGVRNWAHTVVATTSTSDSQRHNAIAEGIGDLAALDYEEAVNQFLAPWARGRCGFNGQITAVYTISALAARPELASPALRTAARWATHGDPQQRLTALLCFSGPLGVSYPDEAIERLWQLTIQAKADDTGPALALANLFAVLAGTDEAGAVPKRLVDAIDTATNRDRRIRALRAGVEILTVADGQVGAPALVYHVAHRPDDMAIAARLLVAVTRYRPLRREAMDALLAGLDRLVDISSEPEEFARALADALRGELTPQEAPTFRQHLAVRQQWRRRRAPAGEPPTSRETRLEQLIRIVSAPLGASTVERRY
ncbi:hypothetical protein [Nocardia nova]|nr:hypothetical protein [Nocardia nova]